MVTKIILCVILICSILIPFGTFLLSKKKEGGFKAALFSNLFFFFGTVIIADILLFSGNVQAADAAGAVAAGSDGLKFIAAALSTGLSCIGAGIGVASVASAAIGAMSEDASIMGRTLIFVALAESIALYGLLISFIIISS
ncbi:ATP synthase subunit C [Lachnospiraceae bacterium ZAX-1]